MTLISVLGGLLLLASGMSLMGWSALLSAKGGGWPSGPMAVRVALTTSGLFLCAHGYVLVTGGDRISIGSFGVFFVVAVFSVTQFVTLLMQRRWHNVYSH